MQAAMLTYRVDPKYPPLMQQIRKNGRIQLHAIISTDGTIESLQVISGDPGFYQSALDAVQIHGAYGCSEEAPVQRYLRDAKIMEIIEGSTEIQQITIAGMGLQNAMSF